MILVSERIDRARKKLANLIEFGFPREEEVLRRAVAEDSFDSLELAGDRLVLKAEANEQEGVAREQRTQS